MKSSAFFPFLAVFFVSCISAMAAPNESSDPVVGRWKWIDPQIVDCKADHTFSVKPTNRTGTWKLLPEKSVERKYSFVWDDGLFVDRLTMSRDEKELRGQNQDGKKIRATKLSSPAQ
jgi:hypothetical protein